MRNLRNITNKYLRTTITDNNSSREQHSNIGTNRGRSDK